MNPLSFIDNLLNRITMYRLVMYYLAALLAIAIVFGAFGVLRYSPLSIVLSTVIILAACWIANEAFAKLFKVPTNFESIYITALILALIISPIELKPFDTAGAWFLVWASFFAMASKYILAIQKKHIFNPAAFGVALTAITINQYASWWVGGNLPLFAFVFIGGLLVVRKIQRFDLVLSFMAAAAITIIALNPSLSLGNALQRIFIHTSVLFFGFIMITEPLTTPPTRWLRVAYGAIVGFLFAPGLHFGTLYYSSPELALVIGNIFSYIVSPKRKYLLKLTSKTAYGTDIYDFAFTGAGVMKFSPGQYMEWTINGTGADSRGNRRYFTIASSPTEKEIHLGVKFYKPSSTFKEKMLALKSGDTLLGGQLAGDFTLPHDTTKKLVFVAGGIGITPFRSMAKYLSDRGEKRDVVLLYSNRLVSEITYAETFDEAEKTIGMKTIYAITDTKESSSRKIHNGRIDAALIKREIPDYQNRIYYLSGPRGMVMAFEKTLSELGVPLTHIKIDFFPGFA